jgi:hypothetical protein
MSETQVETTPNVTPIDKPRVPNAHDLKQQQKLEERLKRTMNQYKINREQALQKIQEEDWNDLPPDKKIRRLEALLSNIVKQIGGDIMNLRSNDSEIADAMDVNLRAFSKMLEKLGITVEEQDKYLTEARAEIAAENAAKKAAAAQEEATGAVVPPEADQFGG